MLNIPLTITPLTNFDPFFSTEEMSLLIEEASLQLSEKHYCSQFAAKKYYKQSLKFLWNDLAKDTCSFHTPAHIGEFISISAYYTSLKLHLYNHILTEPAFYLPISIPFEDLSEVIKVERKPTYCSIDPIAIMQFMSNDITSVTTDLVSEEIPQCDSQTLPTIMKFIEEYTNVKLDIITNCGSLLPASLCS